MESAIKIFSLTLLYILMFTVILLDYLWFFYDTWQLIHWILWFFSLIFQSSRLDKVDFQVITNESTWLSTVAPKFLKSILLRWKQSLKVRESKYYKNSAEQQLIPANILNPERVKGLQSDPFSSRVRIYEVVRVCTITKIKIQILLITGRKCRLCDQTTWQRGLQWRRYHVTASVVEQTDK